MKFKGFHVNVGRRYFGEGTKLTSFLLEHGALSDAHVDEISLRVTFGTSCSRAPFWGLGLVPEMHQDFQYFERFWPPRCNLRNVWRAPLLGTGGFLEPP